MSDCSDFYEQGILWFKSGNFDKARQCWEEAANKGDASAMFCMGVLCISSQYCNLPLAKEWFEKAHVAGHKNARYQLEKLDENDVRYDLADKIFCQSSLVYDNITWEEKKFGNYEWFVIKTKEQKELYLSKYIIDIRKYHNYIESDISWKTSHIRQWLNGHFYDEFSMYEKQLICDTYNENHCNPRYHTECGKPTWDKIFLLSYDELVEYMLDDEEISESQDLLDSSSSYAQLKAVVKMSETKINEAKQRSELEYSMINGQSLGWWLRTLGETKKRAVRVNCNGVIRLHGRELCRNLVGVRPAMWVKKT